MYRAIPAIALSVGLAMLGLVLTSVGPVSLALLIGAVLAFFWGVWLYIQPKLKRYDHYSLEALREAEQQEAFDRVYDIEVDTDAVLCPTCGETYGAAMLRCPNCRCGRS